MRDINFDGQEIELNVNDTDTPSVHTQYILARWMYLMGEPYLSDIEYDKIEKKFKEWYPEERYSKEPWSFDPCPTALLTRIGRQNLICNPIMGYMAESIYSINNWEELRMRLSGLQEHSRISLKVDGWNTRVSYFNGHIVDVQSRGRSGTNLSMNNIYRLFPQTIPYKGRVAVTGELSIPNDRWESYKTLRGNVDQRASVRTALANDDIDFLCYNAFKITIENSGAVEDPYTLLHELGFKTPAYRYVDNFDQLLKMIKYMSFVSKGANYLTDGLVLENSRFQYAIRLGAWEESNMISFVTGYEENQGAYGTFFKILCEPVKNEGKVFSKIAINNVASIIENDLRIGSPIAFNLRSAANVVVDTTATRELQRQWAGNYEGYKQYVKELL